MQGLASKRTGQPYRLAAVVVTDRHSIANTRRMASAFATRTSPPCGRVLLQRLRSRADRQAATVPRIARLRTLGVRGITRLEHTTLQYTIT